MNRYVKLAVLLIAFLFFSNLYCQNKSDINNELQISNNLKSDGFMTKEMINKLSAEQIMEIMRARIDAPREQLREEMDYYRKSGIPRFLTPSVAMVGYIFCFITIFFIVITPFFLNYKRSMILYQTINNMVEKNIDIPSELIIPQVKAKKSISNCKKGILLVFTGISVSLFLIIAAGFSEGSWAVGLIPLFIGFGYLLTAMIEDKRDIKESGVN